jgi:DNA topoisomerase IA
MIKTRRIVMEVDTAQGKLQFEAKGQQAMMHGWRTVAGPRFAQDGREPRPFLPLLNSGDRLFGEIISQHAMAPTNCRRLSEHSFLKDYQPQEFGSVEDTVRALRNLIDAEYVRPERGYLFPTSFGVTVYQLYAQPHQTLPVRQHQSPPRGPLHLVDN